MWQYEPSTIYCAFISVSLQSKVWLVILNVLVISVSGSREVFIIPLKAELCSTNKNRSVVALSSIVSKKHTEPFDLIEFERTRTKFFEGADRVGMSPIPSVTVFVSFRRTVVWESDCMCMTRVWKSIGKCHMLNCLKVNRI